MAAALPALWTVACPAAPAGTCASSDDCDPSQVCVEGLCREVCNFDRECREDEVCSNGACMPAGTAARPDASAADSARPDGRAVDTALHDGALADSAGSDSAMPDAARADTTGLDAALVDTAALDAGRPDTGADDRATPDAVALDTSPLDVSAPDASTLDRAMPDTPTADGTAPDTSAPDMTMPDTAAHDTAPPDTALPDALAPDSWLPDASDAGPTCPDSGIRAIASAAFDSPVDSTALASLDDSHHVAVYLEPSQALWAVILTVDTAGPSVSAGTPVQIADTNIDYASAALARIDESHLLYAYAGMSGHGYAMVLEVDPSRDAISPGAELEHDASWGVFFSLARIDDEHFLTAYQTSADRGAARILTVEVADDTVSAGPRTIYASPGQCQALAGIDSARFLNTYAGAGSSGRAVVLEVDVAHGSVTAGTPHTFDPVQGVENALAQIDATHYFNTYAGAGLSGWGVVLVVEGASGNVTSGTPFEFEPGSVDDNAVLPVDATHFLNVYEGPDSDGWAVVLEADPVQQRLTAGNPFEFGPSGGLDPGLSHVTGAFFLTIGAEHSGTGVATLLDLSCAF